MAMRPPGFLRFARIDLIIAGLSRLGGKMTSQPATGGE